MLFVPGLGAALASSIAAVALSFCYSRAAQQAPAAVVLVGIQVVALPLAVVVLAAQWQATMAVLADLFKPTAAIWIGLVAAAAVCIDLFSLRAYAAGIPISVMRPITTGVSLFGTTVIGLALGEPVTPMRMAGIAAIIIGIVLLSWEVK